MADCGGLIASSKGIVWKLCLFNTPPDYGGKLANQFESQTESQSKKNKFHSHVCLADRQIYDHIDVENDKACWRSVRLQAIRKLGHRASERGVDFVVVSGDLFDSSTPSKHTLVELFSAIRAIPVPVYAIPGNHDHSSPT